jgi:hypothetical protein
MIRVAQQPEYPLFDVEVRQPGTTFLATNPNPSSQDFKKKSYWSKAAPHLHAAYSGICAYTAMYLPQQGSVDHFHPKTIHPHLAYEWSNYRLATGRVNSSKGNLTDILDPFEVENDWFFMDIPSCMVKPNPALDQPLRMRISHTINSLRFNQDESYVQERCAILIDYAKGDVSFGFLERRYPFLAKEVARQNLDTAELMLRFKV